MAKSNKKLKSKGGKKVAGKVKKVVKPKKVVKVKAKSPVKKAAKKAAAGKLAAKASPTKKAKAVVTKAKAVKKAKEVTVKVVAVKPEPAKVVKPLKRATNPVATPKKKDNPISPLPKVAPQLTIFPAMNQRPIAHKPAKAAVDSDKTRYNEKELKEFEALINEKLQKAREEFRILKETLNRNNDEGTDSTSGGNTKVLEDGAETAEKENLSQLAARQLKYITNLENALIRIKNGTYGICSVTGKLIPKERLIAVPHTTQSIEAKMMKQD